MGESVVKQVTRPIFYYLFLYGLYHSPCLIFLPYFLFSCLLFSFLHYFLFFITLSCFLTLLSYYLLFILLSTFISLLSVKQITFMSECQDFFIISSLVKPLSYFSLFQSFFLSFLSHVIYFPLFINFLLHFLLYNQFSSSY